ncbi:MAG TPA: DUF1837 domain-containing protein [Myxococcales bacterium]|nr:DUF1837 domain-containing protein [Myxococcales bacterium]
MHTDLTDRFRQLAEGQDRRIDLGMESLFWTAEVHASNRSARLYVLRSDGNRRPMVGKLVVELSNLAIDYCIPRRKIQEARDHLQRTNSTAKMQALSKQAALLFTDLKNTGEGGELLLFAVAEVVLGLQQAVAKMSLKTSSRMHYHGADGLYVSVAPDGRLRVHYGESKLYANPRAAVSECITSIAPLLCDEGNIGAGSRDAFIFSSQLDLGNPKLEEAILRFLDINSPDFRSPEYCGVVLVGFDRSEYPRLLDRVPPDDSVEESLTQEVADLSKLLSQKADEHGMGDFHIDIVFVPFPSVQAFRDEFLKTMGLV